MRIVVNDTSCLIDLRKAGILHATLQLPFEFRIPITVVETELKGFSAEDIADLQARGLQIIDQPSEQVKRALELRSRRPTLSIHDCLCLALVETLEQGIVLTGDKQLRTEALKLKFEAHGILWVCDHLLHHQVISVAALHQGLIKLRDDPLVFLPEDELKARIQKIADLLK